MPRRPTDTSEPAPPRLGPDDWTRAALRAIAAGGLANLSVERLATELGATKGSFYWHFKDRPALITAALDHWEVASTDRIIEQLDDVADPAERFRLLLESSFDSPRALMDVSLLADADDPVVAAALERVATKRLAFVDQIFVELGSKDGSDRALLAYSAYLGLTQLRRTAPGLTPKGARVQTYIDRTIACLID